MKRVTRANSTITTDMICCSKEAKKQKYNDNGNDSKDDEDMNQKDDQLKLFMKSLPTEIQLLIFDSILQLRAQAHQCRVDALIRTIKEAAGLEFEEYEHLDDISDTQTIYDIQEGNEYYNDIVEKRDAKSSIVNLPDKIQLTIHLFNVAFDKLADISQVTLKKRVFQGFQDVPVLDIEVITPSDSYIVYYDAADYKYICHHSSGLVDDDDNNLRLDSNIHNMNRMEEFLSLGSDRWLQDRDSYETTIEEYGDDDYLKNEISLFRKLKKQLYEASDYNQVVSDEFTSLRMQLSKK